VISKCVKQTNTVRKVFALCSSRSVCRLTTILCHVGAQIKRVLISRIRTVSPKKIKQTQECVSQDFVQLKMDIPGARTSPVNARIKTRMMCCATKPNPTATWALAAAARRASRLAWSCCCLPVLSLLSLCFLGLHNNVKDRIMAIQ